MLLYASFQNWTIGQTLIRAGHMAEPSSSTLGFELSAWITDASETEIRDAAALCGANHLEIRSVEEKESPAEIKAAVDRILRENKPRRTRR